MIRPLDAAAAAVRLPELAALLVDAVAHGASVNFMAGFSAVEGERFWQAQLPGIGAGERVLFVAEAGGAEAGGAEARGAEAWGAEAWGAEAGKRLLGTVVLSLAPQPNAPHRAEIGKMLVHSSARRQGLGRRLLGAAEAAALAAGRSLLLLDTETDSAGERLYRSCGWTALGVLPDHAFTPDGRLAPTTYFYKALGPHRRPGAR